MEHILVLLLLTHSTCQTSCFVEECENYRLIADDIKPVRTPPFIQIPKVETVYLDMAINASEVTHSAAMIEWRHFIEEDIKMVCNYN